MLQRERALEKLPAMQTAAKDKMPFEQRPCLAENLDDFGLCHGVIVVNTRAVTRQERSCHESQFMGRHCGEELEPARARYLQLPLECLRHLAISDRKYSLGFVHGLKFVRNLRGSRKILVNCNLPMLVKSACRYCQSPVEFEAEDYKDGLELPCPKCQQMTPVRVNRWNTWTPAPNLASRNATKNTIVLAYIVSLLVPLAGFFFGVYLFGKKEHGHGAACMFLNVLIILMGVLLWR